MVLRQAVLLLSVIFTIGLAFQELIELPDSAKTRIDECKARARELPIDMQWQVHLACLHAFFTDLPADNLTNEDWILFKEAENNSFGLKPPPSGFRTRKELRTLSQEEWREVTKVFIAMYKQGTLRKFARLHALAINTAHKGAAFLPWHRVFLVHFEEEMRKINPHVSLPYWDYTIDNNITKPTDSVVWTECFFGEDNGTIKSGPFRNLFGAHGALLGRNANRNCDTKLINKYDMAQVKQHCDFQKITTGTENYLSNPHNLEVLHDGVHDWIGGDMGIVQNSAYDPIFWMHHAFIDYIFEEFRQNQQKKCENIDVEANYRTLDNLCQACSDGKTHGHGPDDPMWGYSHLKNTDGLWLNWTTAFYTYDPAPSCPDRCFGKYLYCSKTADPRYPHGLCMSATKEACRSLYERWLRDADDNKPLEPRISCFAGKRLKGLPGDGRTRDMTVEQAKKILERQIEPPSTAPTEIKKQSSNSVGLGVFLGVLLLSIIVSSLLGAWVQRKRGSTASSGTGDYLRM